MGMEVMVLCSIILIRRCDLFHLVDYTSQIVSRCMDPSHNSNTHVLLCSSCQGRGEIWMRGVALSSTGSSEEMNGWINTNLYGLWRDDGTIELLDI